MRLCSRSSNTTDSGPGQRNQLQEQIFEEFNCGFIVACTAAELWNIYTLQSFLTGPLSVGFFFLFRVISCEEGKALAESWNAAFMESSAKENQVRAEPTQVILFVGLLSKLIYQLITNKDSSIYLSILKEYGAQTALLIYAS